jgi:hypothetical protein
MRRTRVSRSWCGQADIDHRPINPWSVSGMANPIGAVLRKSSQMNARPSTDMSGSMVSKVTERVFVRMQSIYGHLWSSQFKSVEILECAKREWDLSLRDLNVRQIGKAIELAKVECRMPPSLPSFLELANRANLKGPHKPFATLPKPNSNPDVARAALDQLRKIVKLPPNANVPGNASNAKHPSTPPSSKPCGKPLAASSCNTSR